MAQLRIARSRAPDTSVTDVQEVGERVRAAKVAKEAAEEEYKAAQADLCIVLTARGVKSMTMPLADGLRYRFTMSQATRIEVNEPGLRKALGAPQFDRLCDLKLNRDKLEIAIAEGRVDPMIVSAHTERKAGNPYIKLAVVSDRAPRSDQEL